MTFLKNLSTLCFIFCAACLFADTDLLENGGFEENSPDGRPQIWKSFNWNVCNNAVLDADEKHGGQYSAKLYRTPEPSYKYPNPTWQTPLMPVSGKIRISAWLKIQDVHTDAPDKSDWHKASISISFFDSEKKKLPGFRTLAEEAGTFDWRRYEKELVVPSKVSFIQLTFSLALCSGTAWIDDVSIVQIDKLAMLDLPEPPPAGPPRIIPTPENIIYGKRLIAADGLKIFIPKEMPGIKKLLSEIVPFKYSVANTADEGDIILSLSHSCGEEEYLLEFKTAKGRNIIVTTAKNEKGIFYALESMRQLLVKKEGISYLQEARIHDKPCFKIRGYVHGGFHGWRGFTTLGESYVKKFGELKYNYVLVEICRSITWDVSQFDGKQEKRNKDYIECCKKYFITPVAEISPGWETEIPCWSDEQFIDKWFGFIERLYETGYREFCFGFDDFQNIGRNKLLTEKDKARFKHLGEAQCYFLTQIHKRIRNKYGKGMRIFVIYHYYSGCIGKVPGEVSAYMEAMKKLPEDILIVWAGADKKIDVKDAKNYLNLSGKKHLAIFDNWYAESERTPELIAFPPVNDRAKNLSESADAYFLNAPIFDREPLGTAPAAGAEYLWAATRYNPSEILPFIILKNAGMDTYREIYKIKGMMRNATANTLSAEQKLQYINDIKEERERSRKLLPASVYGMLVKEMDRIVRTLEENKEQNPIKKQEDRK